MTTIKDLRGFCYPLTPGGVSSLVGDLPWHYATEYLTIAYRTDPAAIAAYLPEPLAPGAEPDLAYVAFSRWWSLWDNQPEMAFTNPERTQYRECAIWVRLERWPANGSIALDASSGAELLVLDGGFEDGEDWFESQSWLRLPPGSALQAKAGPEGCKVWVKTGHLLHIEGLTRA